MRGEQRTLVVANGDGGERRRGGRRHGDPGDGRELGGGGFNARPEPAQGGGAGILTVKLNLPRLGRRRHAQVAVEQRDHERQEFRQKQDQHGIAEKPERLFGGESQLPRFAGV